MSILQVAAGLLEGSSLTLNAEEGATPTPRRRQIWQGFNRAPGHIAHARAHIAKHVKQGSVLKEVDSLRRLAGGFNKRILRRGSKCWTSKSEKKRKKRHWGGKTWDPRAVQYCAYGGIGLGVGPTVDKGGKEQNLFRTKRQVDVSSATAQVLRALQAKEIDK